MPKQVCSYKNCSNTKAKNKELSFHRFPSHDIDIEEEWFRRSGNEAFIDLHRSLVENRRLCSEHFLPTDFLVHGFNKRVIKKGSFPIDIRANINVLDISENTLANNNCRLNISTGNERLTDHNILLENDTVEVIENNSSLENSVLCNLNDFSENDIDPDSIPVLNASVPVINSVKKKLKTKTKKFKSNVEKLTKTNSQLQRKNKLLRGKNKVLQQKFKRQSLKTEKTLTKVEVLNGASQYLNENAMLFLKMQLFHDKKKIWDEDEKYFSLGLYYKSPKVYRYLRDEKKFALPCMTVMKGWVNELTLQPGINIDLFKLIKMKADSMNDYEKECVLMWDEMTIRPFLQYNERDDYIEGFSDLGEHGRNATLANTVLVAMLSGLSYNWKQAVYFAFSTGPVPGTTLKSIITDVLDNVESTGLKVRMMVCDQGASNQKAVTSLGITQDNPFIERHGRKIYFNFDSPHLLKCYRNNLLNNDFDQDDETISWDAIREFREVEKFKSCKAAPKLTKEHLDPNNFQKMNVKLAVQVLSGSVARGMMAGWYTGDLKNPSCVATANFLLSMNNIFDCLNARHPQDPNPLKRGLSEKQPQVKEALREAIPWLEKIKMFNGWTFKYPDCFVNLILTINSMLMFWDDLKNEGREYFLTGKVNQDPNENFFALMRTSLGCNTNPTAMQFRKSFQHGIITTLLCPPVGTNCSHDERINLLSTYSDIKVNKNEMLKKQEEKQQEIRLSVESWAFKEYFDNDVDNVEQMDVETGIEDADLNESQRVTLEKCAMKYVAGYLLSKCLNKFGCTKCKETLTRENRNFENKSDTLIFWKAFNIPENELGNLKVPSDQFYSIILKAYQVFEKEFHLHYTENNIASKLIEFIGNVIMANFKSFWVENDCTEHRKYIIKQFVRVHIFYFLKWICADYRDSGNKRNYAVDSFTNKPNAKLQKLAR